MATTSRLRTRRKSSGSGNAQAPSFLSDTSSSEDEDTSAQPPATKKWSPRKQWQPSRAPTKHADEAAKTQAGSALEALAAGTSNTSHEPIVDTDFSKDHHDPTSRAFDEEVRHLLSRENAAAAAKKDDASSTSADSDMDEVSNDAGIEISIPASEAEAFKRKSKKREDPAVVRKRRAERAARLIQASNE